MNYIIERNESGMTYCLKINFFSLIYSSLLPRLHRHRSMLAVESMMLPQTCDAF